MALNPNLTASTFQGFQACTTTFSLEILLLKLQSKYDLPLSPSSYFVLGQKNQSINQPTNQSIKSFALLGFHTNLYIRTLKSFIESVIFQFKSRENTFLERIY